jgi:hypothetical protein
MRRQCVHDREHSTSKENPPRNARAMTHGLPFLDQSLDSEHAATSIVARDADRIKHMQNGISSGCSALSVKCQVSNHKPVGGAGETNG